MRHEVYNWVASIVERLQPQAPVLEVGSYNVNGTIRDLFPQEGYVGLDRREGPGVDMVSDLTVEHIGGYGGAFNTLVCCETLEHMTDPRLGLFKMHQYLRPGGLLIATWCFAFPIHEEPDYWRATPEGFEMLLRDAGFTEIAIETEGGIEVIKGLVEDAHEPGQEMRCGKQEGGMLILWPRGVFATARRAG